MNPKHPKYQSIIVCGSKLRTQWQHETHRFWPNTVAQVVEAKNLKRDFDKLREQAISENKPLTLIMSYETVRDHADTIRGYFTEQMGNDLVVDEAVVLKNPGSGRSQALWKLREVFQRGIALTGTPIERNMDDMGNILSWVRADRELFYGKRLTANYDPTNPKDIEKLWDALGPTVFRRDRSEIADELPDVQTETILLDPDPAELRLAEAARHGLRDILKELEERMAELADMDPDDPKLAEARAQLKSLRGVALGGITVARRAACDPIAVAESDSAAVALLHSKGLVEPAVRTGGTKRQQVVGLTRELIDNGEAVLIFTDFSAVADHLVQDLKDQGIRVGCIKGGMSDKATADAQDGFQGGKGVIGDDIKYDCLVLTSTAKEGLNLQRASVMIHMDLPWLPSSMVQRVGRASRIGSTSDTLQVLIPVMAGTIEERAAAKLVTRAVEALAVLDNPRGVNAADTEVGQALAGLGGAVSDKEVEKGEQGLLDLARSLIG